MGETRDPKEIKREWLEKNGFNVEKEETYIYSLPDSYNRKDELKSLGYKFNKDLLWHRSEPFEDDELVNHILIKLSDVGMVAAWGEVYLNADAGHKVRELIDARLPKSFSRYLEPAEDGKIYVNVECTEIGEITGVYGPSSCYYFLAEGRDEIVWYTTSHPDIQVGDLALMTANFKQHREYKNKKITVVTRAKFQK